MKGLALGLTLKQRQKATQKLPIVEQAVVLQCQPEFQPPVLKALICGGLLTMVFYVQLTEGILYSSLHIKIKWELF